MGLTLGHEANEPLVRLTLAGVHIAVYGADARPWG